jgi:hypothetical protein
VPLGRNAYTRLIAIYPEPWLSNEAAGCHV